MVNIPSDLRKNKEKIVGNFDLREFLSVFLGVTLAVAILYYFRVVLQIKRVVILAFLAGLVTIPFLAIGFKKINGMKLTDYIRVFINNNILSKPVRSNVCPSNEKHIKDKRYEITRFYKLHNENDLIKMREHLKDKLILTEYIKLKGDIYAVFRIDGKEMIQEYQNRNKTAIENLGKEINLRINERIKLNLKGKERTNSKNNEIEIDKIEIEKLRTNNEKQSIAKMEKLEIYNAKIDIENQDSVEIDETNIEKEEPGNIEKQCVDKIESVKIEKLKLQNSIQDKVVLNNEIKTLKKQMSKLLKKKFDDIKSEVDIFENLENIIKERIDDTKPIEDLIKEDKRKVYELNLFDKREIRDFISETDRIVFINADDMVDIFLFDRDNLIDEAKENIVDMFELNQKIGFYECIKNIKARNFYNHYRNIDNLDDVL